MPLSTRGAPVMASSVPLAKATNSTGISCCQRSKKVRKRPAGTRQPSSEPSRSKYPSIPTGNAHFAIPASGPPWPYLPRIKQASKIRAKWNAELRLWPTRHTAAGSSLMTRTSILSKSGPTSSLVSLTSSFTLQEMTSRASYNSIRRISCPASGNAGARGDLASPAITALRVSSLLDSSLPPAIHKHYVRCGFCSHGLQNPHLTHR